MESGKTRTQVVIRIVIGLMTLAHMVLAVNQPNIADDWGVRLGYFHFLWLFLQLAIFGKAMSDRFCANLRSTEGSLCVITFAVAAWLTLGHALGSVEMFTFRPAFFVCDALGLLGIIFWRGRRNKDINNGARDSGVRNGNGLLIILALIVVRFAAPWGSNVADWIITPPTNPDTIEYYFYTFQNTLHTGSIRLLYSYMETVAVYFPSAFLVLWNAFFIPLEGTDYFAIWLQVPAIVLTIFAFYSAATSAGASRNAALIACCVLATQKHLWIRQNISYGGTDIWSMGFLTAGLALVLGSEKKASFGPTFAAGAALGIAAGLKVEGLMYATAVLAVGLAVCRLRLQFLLFTLPGIFLTGSYSYIRNLFFAGNPVFPRPVSVLGLTIFPGIPGHMATTSYGPFSWQTPLEIFSNGFEFTQGATVIFAAGWLILFASIVKSPKKTPWPEIAIVLLPFALYGLFLLHPLRFTRRLYFPLLTAGISFAILLTKIRFDENIGDSLIRLKQLFSPPAIEIKFFRTAAASSTIAGLIAVGVYLPSVVYRYQSEKMDRMSALPHYSNEGILWKAVDNATHDSSDTIGLVNMKRMYPFTGSALQNRVVNLPYHGTDLRFDWGWGDAPVFPFSHVDTGTLMERLRRADIGLVAAQKGCPEERALRDGMNKIIAESDAGTVFQIVTNRQLPEVN